MASSGPAEAGIRERVLRALDAVIDPELDEPITSLRFVSWRATSAATETSKWSLRLPTPQCAPNFAFLMAADARAAVRRLPGVGRVTITLEDHYTADEINAALERWRGIQAARSPARPTTTNSARCVSCSSARR